MGVIGWSKVGEIVHIVGFKIGLVLGGNRRRVKQYNHFSWRKYIKHIKV